MSQTVQTTPPTPTSAPAVASAGRPGATPWVRSLTRALMAIAVVLVVMLAFLWPTLTSTPRGLELDVVGGAQAQALVDDALDAVDEKTDSRPFDTTAVDTREEAERRIRAMESYGAVVVDDAGDVEVLTATAANATAAQLLQQVAAQIGQAEAQAAGQERAAQAQEAAQLGAEAAAKGAAAQTLAGVLEQMGGAEAAAADPQAAALAQRARAAGEEAQTAAAAAQEARTALEGAAAPTLTLTDLAPHPDADPRGAAFALAGLPMALGGIVGGSLLSFSLRGTGRRLLGVIAYGVVGGWAIVAVLGPWLGVLTGNLFTLWAVVGMTLIGTASVIVGLHSLIGTPGVPVGGVLTMLVANPISGAQAPSSFLPGAWGQIGQFFVPGATAGLLRAVGFFPDAHPVQGWLVLAGWILLGLLLILVGHHRTGRRAAALEA